VLSIERIYNWESFSALRSEWNSLLERSQSDCVFLTHEWLATWWKHLSERRTLHILLVRDGKALIGILPLALQRPQYSRMMPRVLEFLGSGVIGSDYLDVIADREREPEVLEAFAHHLTSSGYMLQFSQLRRKDCAIERLAAMLQTRNWAVNDTGINVCPFVDLNGHTWDTYLASLGSSQRYNFQRRLRNLEKTEGFRFEQAQSPEDAVHALDVLIELHKKRWDARGGLSEAFQTNEIVAFHREFIQLAAERGWLRLLSIWIKEIPAAALYGFQYGRTFYFYQSGFDTAFSKQSVGLVMMGLAIRTAAGEGAREFDLLHGNEEYKLHWTRQTRELGRTELYPPHARGAFYRHCIGVNRAARRVARRIKDFRMPAPH
jgi:CelD/BcsL family acetyltransferase involved in cellulose biosynthesis